MRKSRSSSAKRRQRCQDAFGSPGASEKREHEIIELAKKEADSMRERAKADIDAAKDQALAAIREEVVDISLSAAGQILKRRVDAEDDRRLVAELVSANAQKEG